MSQTQRLAGLPGTMTRTTVKVPWPTHEDVRTLSGRLEALEERPARTDFLPSARSSC
jgi:hypothetical protein